MRYGEGRHRVLGGVGSSKPNSCAQITAPVKTTTITSAEHCYLAQLKQGLA